MDKDKAEPELATNIKKATSTDETAPKRKHVHKCIQYTWDHHSSISFWSGLRVQPILSNDVQVFKALILVHKVLQEGHPVTIEEAQSQTGWLETCSRTIGHNGGYGPLVRTYVQFLLAKLRFHQLWPEFNGLFGYEEYVNLKRTDDPNEGYETVSDLMQLQDQVESFQKTVFSHFRASANNECRISSLVPLIKESGGVYRFITSMLWAMYRRINGIEALEPLRQRYHAQHYSLHKFYSECSNLEYLTGLMNVPKLSPEPPRLFYNEGAPALTARPTTAAKSPTLPPAAPAADEAEERRRQEPELERQQQVEFEQRQREQQDRERLALDASPSQPGGSSLPIAAAAGAATPTRPQPEPSSSSSSSPRTLHSSPHFPSTSLPLPQGFGAPTPFPPPASISAPATGPSSTPAPVAAPLPLPISAPSKAQEAVSTDRVRTECERWDRMDVLYQSIRNNARQFGYPAASVAALESVLVRMYFESPLSAPHPQAHPVFAAPTVPSTQAAPQPPPPPPPEYNAICHEDQSNVLEVGPSRPWHTRAHDGTHALTSASDIRSH